MKYNIDEMRNLIWKKHYVLYNPIMVFMLKPIIDVHSNAINEDT